MGKGRLEAFSDGVMAIIITIMVLEMKVPHGNTLADLKPLAPVFISYILSFINIGIYWNNHHHLMHAVHKIDGKVMWANNHLLFWLSLMPFASGWMGENHFAALPTALLGIDLCMAGIAYYLLAHCLVSIHGKDSVIGKALGKDIKGKLSVVIYAIAVPLAWISGWISLTLYGVVAIMWLIPDKRIENILNDHTEGKPSV
jgi:uncharacterized membrane protein